MTKVGYKSVAAPENVSKWAIDPYAETVLLQPENFYDELLSYRPFVYLEKYGVLATGDYNVIREVLNDHKVFVSSRGVGLSDFKVSGQWRKPSALLETDQPDHTRVRKVVMSLLNPKNLKELQPIIDKKAAEIVSDALDRGHVDGVLDIGTELALSIFPDAFGLTSEDRRPVLEYAGIVVNTYGPDNELRAEALERAEVINPLIAEQVARENLRKGSWGYKVYEEVDKGNLTEEEAMLVCRTFLTGGVHTTATAIGNILLSLAKNPEEFQKLKLDPSLSKSAFDEAERLHTQIHSFYRTAVKDTEVAGVKIEKDSKVFLVTAAANLDPEKWDSAKEFRADRRPMGHFGFSAGIHTCAGQNLARNEGAALISELAKQVGTITLAGEVVRQPNNAGRVYLSLPLKFEK